MALRFATATARLNTAVFAHLADTDATLNGAPVVGMLDAGFDDPTLAGFGTVGSSPKFLLAASSVPAHPEGMALVIASGIGAGAYKVAQAYPDATGSTVLHLLSKIT